MKPQDIKAGLKVSVGWFRNSHMLYRSNYEAHGNVVCRRGGRIKFQWVSGDSMDADFIATPSHSCEFFWVNVLDIRSINETPIREWLAARAPQADKE